MAYDKEKAHEYYMKYRKKGLLKGRKKGKGKVASKGKKSGKKGSKKSSKAKTPKIKKESLLGLSNSGLNEAGKMEWAVQKKDIQDKMNQELQTATSEEQKAEIRKKYQEQALAKLTEIKNDSKYHDEKIEGTASGGLNDAGKMKWTMEKKNIQKAMNEELKNATTDDKKKAIREKYQKQAQDTLDAMKKDTNYAKPKKAKKTKKTKKTKTKTSKSKVKKIDNALSSIKAQMANLSSEKKEALKDNLEKLLKKLEG